MDGWTDGSQAMSGGLISEPPSNVVLFSMPLVPGGVPRPWPVPGPMSAEAGATWLSSPGSGFLGSPWGQLPWAWILHGENFSIILGLVCPGIRGCSATGEAGILRKMET